MPVKVIDASAVAAILFGEPDADELVNRAQGHVLLAPMRLPVEVASVCVKKCRRHPLLHDRLLAAFGLLGRMREAVQASPRLLCVFASQR